MKNQSLVKYKLYNPCPLVEFVIISEILDWGITFASAQEYIESVCKILYGHVLKYDILDYYNISEIIKL